MIAIAFLGTLFAVTMTGPANGEEESATWVVYGRVEIDQEDDEGNVISVFIDDPDQGEFLVAADGKGPELLGHVGDTVEATGWVSEDDETGYFDYVLHVNSYTVMEDEP
jgi:hypothetical protein